MSKYEDFLTTSAVQAFIAQFLVPGLLLMFPRIYSKCILTTHEGKKV